MDHDSPSPPKRRKVVAVLAPRPSISDLMNVFGATKSPTSVSKMDRESAGHSLRGNKSSVSYAESPLTSPEKTPRRRSISSNEDDFEDAQEAFGGSEEDDEAESEDELNSDDVIHAVPRGTAARLAEERKPEGTRQLPARSTRANVSYARPVIKKKISTLQLKKKSKTILASDTGTSASKTVTSRGLARQDIAAHTKPKRDAYLLANKDYFQPLLPENSYINKLERREGSAASEETTYVTLDKQPQGVKATMKPYQLEGLSFLVHMHENGMSAILGDEMGLGKTLQTLALFQYLVENKSVVGENRPYLVVCPLSVLSSWMSESKKWVPGLNVFRFHGPKAEREKFKVDCLEKSRRYENSGKRTNTTDENDRIDLVVTTYETFSSEQNWFKRSFVWRYCILDEGHKIKNDTSGVSLALQGLSAEYRLLLTGTPLQNNLKEMWALLHWLFPEVFTIDTAEQFRKAFDLTKGTVSTSFMDDARRLLELIMIRRMKSTPGVDLGLPPKEEVLLYVPLTPMQRFWYTRLLTKADKATLDDLFAGAKDKETQKLQEESDDEELARLEEAGAALDNAKESDTTDVWQESRAIMEEALKTDQTDSKGRSWMKLMNLLMQLRKACNHPYLLPNAAPHAYEIGPHVKNASGKFIVLDKLIDELVLKQKKKVLIFSGFTRTLDLVDELLLCKGVNGYQAPFRSARLDGRTSRAQRNLSIRMFNDMRSEYQVMLLSTRAGGLGINLTSATDVVFMDEDWNPQVTLQAEARAHRIGQTQKVTIYKLCSQGTVEEQMMGRIRKKLYLSAKITESMRNIHTAGSQDKKRKRQPSTATAVDEDAPQLDTASLQSLIRRGAQTLARPEIDVTEMLTWDWETTLENCKDKPIDALVGGQAGKKGLADVDEQKWLNSMEKVECAVFEGKKHMKEIEKKIEETTELNRLDRRVGKNTTVMVDGFAINKESLNCADWEAVPTLAGKDPRLAEPKREKAAPIQHQEFCQHCWNSGQLTLCHGCPRAYHSRCLSEEFQVKAKGMSFYCPQHECLDCGAKTSEAGGMIYRCRWCENGFCEDCMDWDTIRLLGDSLPEYQMLDVGRVIQAYFIDCQHCINRWKIDPADHKSMLREKKRIDIDYEAFIASFEGETGTSAERTPDTISEVATPVEELPFVPRLAKKFKLKVAPPVEEIPKFVPRLAKKAKLAKFH